MDNAGETLSDARMETSEGPRATGKLRPGGRAYREEIETRGLSSRGNRDREGAPTGKTLRYETPSFSFLFSMAWRGTGPRPTVRGETEQYPLLRWRYNVDLPANGWQYQLVHPASGFLSVLQIQRFLAQNGRADR